MSIRVRDDLWILGADYILVSKPNICDPNLKVTDLIDYHNGGCNIELIHELFLEADFRLIVDIPLSLHWPVDRLCWYQTKMRSIQYAWLLVWAARASSFMRGSLWCEMRGFVEGSMGFKRSSKAQLFLREGLSREFTCNGALTLSTYHYELAM